MDASSALATKLDIVLHIESDAPLLARKSKRHAPDDDDPIASDPEAVQVRQWRHRLQKTFLSARVAPKEEDMTAMDALFRTTEEYNKMSPQYLSYSKIGKVMRHIAELEDGTIPRDDEWAFRERASALLRRWYPNPPPDRTVTGVADGVSDGVVVGGDAET